MADNTTGELRRCSDFFVTYYWTLPAHGIHFYTNVAVIIISSLSAVLGTVANIVVALAYFKNSRLWSLSNIPLISLAFSDLLVTAIVLPLRMTRLVNEIYGTHNCILWTTTRLTSYFSAGVSLLTVTFISVERFITLRYPYRHQTILTRLRTKIIIAIIWCLTFALVISHLGLIPYKIFLALCGIVVIICITTLLSIWTWVLRLLRNHKKRIKANNRPSQCSRNGKKSKPQAYKNTRTSAVIVAVLIICYSPLIFMFAYYWTEPKSHKGIYIVTPWGETTVYAHSFLNPLIVVWKKSEFRQTARYLICRLKCMNNVNSVKDH